MINELIDARLNDMRNLMMGQINQLRHDFEEQNNQKQEEKLLK